MFQSIKDLYTRGLYEFMDIVGMQNHYGLHAGSTKIPFPSIAFSDSMRYEYMEKNESATQECESRSYCDFI